MEHVSTGLSQTFVISPRTQRFPRDRRAFSAVSTWEIGYSKHPLGQACYPWYHLARKQSMKQGSPKWETAWDTWLLLPNEVVIISTYCKDNQELLMKTKADPQSNPLIRSHTQLNQEAMSFNLIHVFNRFFIKKFFFAYSGNAYHWVYLRKPMDQNCCSWCHELSSKKISFNEGPNQVLCPLFMILNQFLENHIWIPRW